MLATNIGIEFGCVRLKPKSEPEYSAYVHPPISKEILGPSLSKMGPAKNTAVPAVAARTATVAFSATVGSTWPEPPIPVRALYI